MRDSERAGSISRRDFLRRATVGAVVASAALVVGEEMFELLERLGPRRLLVPGYPLWSAQTGVGEPLTMRTIKQAQANIYGVSLAEWDRILKEVYAQPIIDTLQVATPFRDSLIRVGG